MVINHDVKRFLFKRYAPISALVFAAAMVLVISGKLDWQTLGSISVGAYAFAFTVQKQNLEETTLFKELFEQFNKRYDKMNDDLNMIWEQPADKQLNEDEIKKLFKYFNLCGEEYLYYHEGFICPEVWAVWKSGMNYFRKNSRIKEFWDKELSDNRSYYGLAFQENVGVDLLRPRTTFNGTENVNYASSTVIHGAQSGSVALVKYIDVRR
jgi:hypothetical protein